MRQKRILLQKKKKCCYFRYRIVTHLSARVSRLNPDWNSEGVDSDAQFVKAMDLCGEEFKYFIHNAASTWLPARAIVREAIAKRFEVNSIHSQISIFYLCIFFF